MNDEATELDHLLFGTKFAHEDTGEKRICALQATENQDVLVFDYCHWGNVNVLVMKFEARGLFILERTDKRIADPVINVLMRVRTSLKSVVCDNAVEFLKVRPVCEK